MDRRVQRNHHHVILRQVYRLFQSEFSRKSDLALPLSIASIFSFTSGFPAAVYVFWRVMWGTRKMEEKREAYTERWRKSIHPISFHGLSIHLHGAQLALADMWGIYCITCYGTDGWNCQLHTPAGVFSENYSVVYIVHSVGDCAKSWVGLDAPRNWEYLLPRIQTRFFWRPACSLVTVPAALPRRTHVSYRSLAQ
jgi:hypothetical protein